MLNNWGVRLLIDTLIAMAVGTCQACGLVIAAMSDFCAGVSWTQRFVGLVYGLINFIASFSYLRWKEKNL